MGSGSGYVTCSIALLLRKAGYYAHCIAVDVSPPAADATHCTLEAHSVRILQSCHILPRGKTYSRSLCCPPLQVLSADVLCGDLVGPLAQRIRGCVDLLVRSN